MSSVEEIGRQLREAREERGLDLLAVHDQLNRPITQLEALEQGDLTRLPDQALALSTLRRYAVFLGLDGDALALGMIDAWSVHPPGARPNDQGAITSVTAAVTTGPDHLRAFTQTGQVPRVRGGSTAAPGQYGFGITPGAPTGTFPVVPKHEIQDSKRAVARARRRLRAPTPLKVVTWVAAGLVVLVVAGFAVYQWRPDWLARSHILRVSRPGSAAPAPAPSSGTTPSSAAASPTTPSTPAGQPASTVVPGASSANNADYTVNAKHFTVSFVTSDRVWVEATSSDSQSPLLEGIQPAGTRQSFDSHGATVTLQVGASAVVVAVTVNGKENDPGRAKVVYYNTPQATPFTYVFAPAST